MADYLTFPEHTPSEDGDYACWQELCGVVVVLTREDGQWWERGGDCLQTVTAITAHVTHFRPDVLPTERPPAEYAAGNYMLHAIDGSIPPVMAYRTTRGRWVKRGKTYSQEEILTYDAVLSGPFTQPEVAERMAREPGDPGAVEELVKAIESYVSHDPLPTRSDMLALVKKHRGPGKC